MTTMGKIFAVIAALVIIPATQAFEIIAHRGASFDAPENSLAAMQLAWKQGADAIETDIHLSSDGKLVVIHDPGTKRTAGVDKPVKLQTWNELGKLDVGAWKAPAFKGELLPTLDSIFATIPRGKAIYIEIKSSELEILDALERAMTASGKQPEQLKIIVFSYDMAKAAKKRFPKHPVAWLHSYEAHPETKEFPRIDDLITKAKAANLDGLDLNFKFPIDKAFVGKVHAAGLKLYTWTVNDPAIARAEIAAGVDGITTDRPEWLRQQLKETK